MNSTEFASFLPASVGPTGLARAKPPYAPHSQATAVGSGRWRMPPHACFRRACPATAG